MNRLRFKHESMTLLRSAYKTSVHNGSITVIFALICFVIYEVETGPLAELLGVLSGLLLGTIAHHHWLSAEIEHERRREREDTIEQIQTFRRHGLREAMPERDPTGAGFFDRVRRLDPKAHISIIGITVKYIITEKPTQLRILLKDKPNLCLQICLLCQHSPYAEARSREVEADTVENIQKSLQAWENLKKEFPGRIEVCQSTAIPYLEFEGYDIDLNVNQDRDRDRQSAHLYMTPIPYKAHTNEAPSFLIGGPSTAIFTFWVKVMRNIWSDAKQNTVP